MFSILSGTVVSLAEKNITLLSGSLGFDIYVPNETLFIINTERQIFIHMHWNQEQGPTLFGFTTQSERDIFKHIISCSGIGPRLGLTILAQLSPGELLSAISTNDIKVLSSISGIGTKKAEQIIVQLKNKVTKILESDIDVGDGTTAKHLKELSDVLNSLNYSRPEINDALQHVRSNIDSSMPFDKLLRDALSFLTKLR